MRRRSFLKALGLGALIPIGVKAAVNESGGTKKVLELPECSRIDVLIEGSVRSGCYATTTVRAKGPVKKGDFVVFNSDGTVSSLNTLYRSVRNNHILAGIARHDA